jgi:hypothetical protein
MHPDLKAFLLQHEKRIAVETIVHESGHAVASRYLGEAIDHMVIMAQLPGGWSQVHRVSPACPMHECLIALAGATAHRIFFGTEPSRASWSGDREDFCRRYKELPEYKPGLGFLRSHYRALRDRIKEVLSQPDCQDALTVLAGKLITRMKGDYASLPGAEVEQLVDPILRNLLSS